MMEIQSHNFFNWSLFLVHLIEFDYLVFVFVYTHKHTHTSLETGYYSIIKADFRLCVAQGGLKLKAIFSFSLQSAEPPCEPLCFASLSIFFKI